MWHSTQARTLLAGHGRRQTEIAAPTISRRHARITIGQSVTLEDLGSKNGTWLENERLTAPRALEDGNVVRLGSTHIYVSSGSTAEVHRIDRRTATRSRSAGRLSITSTVPHPFSPSSPLMRHISAKSQVRLRTSGGPTGILPTQGRKLQMAAGCELTRWRPAAAREAVPILLLTMITCGPAAAQGFDRNSETVALRLSSWGVAAPSREAPLPANLIVPDSLRPLVTSMWLQSLTFRRQCASRRAPRFRHSYRARRPRAGGLARARLERHGDGGALPC